MRRWLTNLEGPVQWKEWNPEKQSIILGPKALVWGIVRK